MYFGIYVFPLARHSFNEGGCDSLDPEFNLSEVEG